jgi:hypothetical protein
MVKKSYCSTNNANTESSIIDLNNSNNYSYTSYTYKSSNKLSQLNLPSEYLKPEKEFKIERLTLEKKVDDLQGTVMEYIEKGGMIEMEVEKILSNSSSIYNYIENNLSLVPQVNFFLERVKKHKEAKINFRKYFLLNANKLILKGNKKKNCEKVKNILKNVNTLVEIIENLTNLSKDPSKVCEENDLLNKGKEIIKQMKSNSKIRIFAVLEKELLNYNSKSSEKMNEEFCKLFMKMMKGTISFVNTTDDYDSNEEMKYVKFYFYLAKRLKYTILKLKIYSM